MLFCLLAAGGLAQTPQANTQRTPEPPRVKATRQFLARRGIAPGIASRIVPGLRRQPHTPIPAASGNTILPEASGSTIWIPAGPVAVSSLQYGLVTGRISSIALDPSDSTGNTVFVGATGGGLWKSQNAAASTPSSVQFLPATDNLAALSGALDAGVSIGAVTVQPGATGVVLAGLGDPNDALDSYYGAGLLRSTDGGHTWTLIQQTMDLEEGLGSQDYSFIGEGFAGFAWSTANVQLVVAAISQAYEGTLVNALQNSSSYEGLYWSNDGGATWHLARITDQNGEDVQGPFDGFDLPDGNAATSVVWNPIRQIFIAAVRNHGYYQSSDGMNWTQLPYYPNGQPGAGFTAADCPTEAGSVGVAGCPVFRGSLAVNPVTGDTFAWSVDSFNQDQGIWQDQCAVVGFGSGAHCGNASLTFGVQLGTAALETSDANGPVTIENGDYNLTLAAIPTGSGAGGDTLLFAGDDDLWKCSLANSCAWRNTTNSTTCISAAVGEYQHTLTWDAGNPLLLYVGTDSGLWRSVDDVAETGAVCASTDASHWQNLNGSLGSLAEINSLAQPTSAPATMLAGLGANGTTGIANAPTTPGDWNQILSGEGGPVAADPTSSTNSWYANNGAGVSIFHCSSSNAATACTPAGFGITPVVGETQVADDGISMTTPAAFAVDALSPSQLLVATCRVWRGPASGSGWSASNAISPILDGTGGSICDGNAIIRSITSAPITGGEVIYAGMAGQQDGGGVVAGHLFTATISTTGTVSAWTDQSFSPVTNSAVSFNGFEQDISGLYIDPHDATGMTLYVTISGFDTSAEAVQQLYQTTDGGAHWTSLRSNLPNAPANAVLVDVQDPNTVYVATDVGVYMTRAISTCGAAAGSGATCWSPFGSGLPLAPVTTLTASSSGAANEVLTAGTYGRGIWQIPEVTAGITLTTATVTPTSLNFAAQALGSTSAAQTVTLKTTGANALTISSAAFTGSAASDFSETDTCVGATLTNGRTCTLSVKFSPGATGTRTANLAIAANVSGGQLLVPLTGTGQAAGAITLLPASLAFSALQQVGTTSPTQTISISNTGGSTVSISSIAVTAPFAKTASTCGSSLAAGVGCTVTLDFAPTAAGAASGTFTVTDGAGTQTASLSGTGVLGPTDTLSTTSLSFPSTVLGQTSAPLGVTITNSGGLPLTSIGTSVTSTPGATDFKAVDNCGGTLAAGSSCSITVTFAPSVASGESGTLTISDALRAQTVRLAGTGLKPPLISLSATTLSFGSEQINTSTAAKTITITNKGGSPLGQPSFSVSGAGSASFAAGTTTCGATVAVNASCTVAITFTPQAAGATTATLSVGTTSPGVASASVTLSGTGLLPPILGVSPSSLNFGSVVVGNSSNLFTVQVTNAGQVTMALPTFAVSGITGPTGAMLSDFALSPPTDIAACTGTLAPAAACNIQVTFSPSVVGIESATLTVTAANAIPSTTTVSLTGTGSPPILLQSSVSSLTFPATPVGLTSAPLTASISNLGKQGANSLTLTLAGPYSNVPALTTCGPKLGAASSCTAAINYTPTAAGNQPGTLTVSVSNLGVAPLVIPLDGSGLAVGDITVNPTQMTFGSVVVKTVSAVQSLTVTNSGQASLNALTISSTGDFSLIGDTCPATLAAGASCSTGIELTPSTTGIRSGTLTVSSSSSGVTPVVVPLTGNGIPPGSMTASPAVVSFAAEIVGATSPAQTVTITNGGTITLAGLAYTAAGDYALASNNCATTLASAASCTFTVTFTPTVPGTRIGSVTIQSTTSGFTPVLVGLTGTGLPTAQLAVSPSALAFPSVAVGSSSSLNLTISNPGTGILQGLSTASTTPFSVGSGTCGTSLVAGGSCVVPVTFAPLASGLQNGTVTVSTTSLGVPLARIAASGTGLAPAVLTLTPATLTFPGTALGAKSPAQTVTLANTGGLPAAGLAFSVTGAALADFTASSSNCPTTLSGGASCTISVVFAPAVVGGRAAQLTASSTTAGAGNTPITASASLNGTGLTPAVLSIAPAGLTFPATLLGQLSATQIVTVTNSGQAGISDLQVAVTAGFGLDPAKTTCTQVLNGGASCTVGVIFEPTTGGAITGGLTASSALSGAIAATATLAGSGALPPGIVTAPAALVQFPTTGVGQPATPVQVTITNQGTLSALTGLSLTVDATGTQNGFSLSANTCIVTLAPVSSCTVNVTFAPTAVGSLTGTLILSSANGGASARLQLVGIGFDFHINVLGSNSITVVQGQTAYYTLALSTLGGVTQGSGGKYTFQCANLPPNALCVFNPAQLSVLPTGVTGNDMLGIGTGAAALNARAYRLSTLPGAALLFCGLLALRLRKSKSKASRHLLLLTLMLAGVVSAVSSCAGAGGSGGELHLGGGTPPATYTVTVSASVNGLTHTVNVSLIVN